MKIPNIFKNPRLRVYTWIVLGLALVILVINVFKLGGDAFIFLLNSNLNFPLAILVTVAAASIWGSMSSQNRRRRLWLYLFLGWGAWAVAETYWAVAAILGQEVPYPSFADLFWMIGYLPILVGIIARIRAMHTHPTRRQGIFIAGISGVVILATTVLILVPILQDFNPSALIESVLNLLYPLVDVVLVILVLRLFFTYEKGEYGFVWRLIAFGFILMTISDLLFAYANLGEFYYPDMRANLVSRLIIDVPYTFAYLVWWVAILAFREALRQERPEISVQQPSRVPNYGHILVYLLANDTTLDVSHNYTRLFAATETKERPLAEILTISDAEARLLGERLRLEHRVADLPIQVRDRFGMPRPVSLSGVTIFNPEGDYMGANLLLRVPTDDRLFDEMVNEEDRAMTRYLLRESGSAYREDTRRFLTDYYAASIRSLLSLVEIEGGAQMSGAMLHELQQIADENHWDVHLNAERVLDGSNCTLEELHQVLPALLESAVGVTSRLTDPAAVQTHMQELSEKFTPEVRGDLEHCLQAGSELRLATGS